MTLEEELREGGEYGDGCKCLQCMAADRIRELEAALRRAQKEIWRKITADGDIRTGYVPGLYEEIDALLATSETEAK